MTRSFPDFSDKRTQERIEGITQRFENSSYIDASVTTSWLREFLDYVERNKGYEDISLPIDTEADFAHTLETMYFAEEFSPMRLDVAFQTSPQGYKRVSAARFLIQVSG